MNVERIEEPRTYEERELWGRIEALQRDYQKQIQPYIDRLTAIEATKVPRFWLRTDPPSCLVDARTQTAISEPEGSAG